MRDDAKVPTATVGPFFVAPFAFHHRGTLTSCCHELTLCQPFACLCMNLLMASSSVLCPPPPRSAGLLWGA